jgi:hypothetical protein
MGTTGPFWVLFLAIVGAVGLPLTVAFAHLLAAVLVGLSGFVVFILARRVLGLWQGLFVSVLWWLPFALIFPLGSPVDFGALNTEVLPCLLLLVAALFPTQRLIERPWLFIFVGAICAVAVGCKYQVLPVAGALLIAQLMMLRLPIRRCIPAALWWCAGFAIPIAAIVVAVLVSQDVSWSLVEQNFGFLGSYAGGVTLGGRISNTLALLATQKFLWGALLLIARLFWISDRPVRIARTILVLSGFVAVLAGGMGFGHYLIILHTALALAAVLPIKPGTELLPWPIVRRVAVVVSVVLIVAVVIVGVVTRYSSFSSPTAIVKTLSPDSVARSDAAAEVCPPGSNVLVWGWAAELYVQQSWRNSVPFMNTLGLRIDPEVRNANAPLVEQALAESDCVVDAVGAPYFGPGVEASILSVYPEFADILDDDFTIAPNALDCESCTVYVRKD